jgi:uncharacterized membrane protein YecN with MAPEG domain
MKKNGYAIYYVKNKTPKICIEAIKQNPNAIKYVPSNMKQVLLIELLQLNIHNRANITQKID